jgi:hypothetical protein
MSIARGSVITAAFNRTGAAIASLATGSYNQAAGEVIIVFVRWEGNSALPTGVTDTAGNTYTQRTTGVSASVNGLAIYDCLNSSANASNVITATWAAATAQYVMVAPFRYTKTGTVTFNASPAAATGTSTTPATAAFSAGQFAVAVATNNSGFTATSSNAGWTTQVNDGIAALSQDRIDSPGGTYAAGCTFSGSDNWEMIAASYTETTATAPNLGETNPTFMVMRTGFGFR